MSYASTETIKQLKERGGMGGVIALDAEGHYSMPFNSGGMFRGVVGQDGIPHVFIGEI